MKNKYFYLPVFVLASYWIFRLINQAQLIFRFPIDYKNDWASHLSNLHFLVKYGYGALVPNWYGGYELFKFYPPGWHIITSPLVKITGNLLLSTYLSIIFMFGISFFAIWILGKKFKLSYIKRIFIFLVFSANPWAIGNYIRLGRMPELFALTIFVCLACFYLYYLNKKLNWKSGILLGVLYFFLMIAHPATAIGVQVLSFGFLLAKWKEKWLVIFSVLGGLLASSFWWVGFLYNILTAENLVRLDFAISERLLNFVGAFSADAWASFIIIPGFILLFYLYYISNGKNIKDLLLFSPLIFIGFLVVTRLIIYIPFLTRVYPDVWFMMMIFFSGYFFVRIKKFPLEKYFWLILGLVSVVSIVGSHYYIDYFPEEHPAEDEMKDVISMVSSNVFIMHSPSYEYFAHSPASYAYGTVYYDIMTPVGCMNFGTISADEFEHFTRLARANFENQTCSWYLDSLEELNVEQVIAYNDSRQCEWVSGCGLKETYRGEFVCLYEI